MHYDIHTGNKKKNYIYKTDKNKSPGNQEEIEKSPVKKIKKVLFEKQTGNIKVSRNSKDYPQLWKYIYIYSIYVSTFRKSKTEKVLKATL